jgi:hypothetical protein
MVPPLGGILVIARPTGRVLGRLIKPAPGSDDTWQFSNPVQHQYVSSVIIRR